VPYRDPYDHWSTWQAEQAGNAPLPSALRTLAVFAALALVLLVLLAGAAPTAQGGGQLERGRDVTLCQEHPADPAWQAICREAAGR
jgi:hypothetical protein